MELWHQPRIRVLIVFSRIQEFRFPWCKEFFNARRKALHSPLVSWLYSVMMSARMPPSWMPTPARVSGLLWASAVALKAGGLPDIGLFFNGGLGDDILCTAVARELKKRGAGRIWQLTRHPELLAGNTDVLPVPVDFRLRRLCAAFGIPCPELEYPHPPPAHLIATLCKEVGVTGEIELRPYVHLTGSEKQAGHVTARPAVAMQTSSMSARFPMRNKQWPLERFQAVTDALKGEFDIVQLGSPTDPPLVGALDLRGKTSVRESAAILASSKLFIGLVSGLMHLARAVDRRSVIVYGGREHPAQSGYPANENLYWNGPCAPCWQRDDCDYDRVCMKEILPDMVLAAARRQLALDGVPLKIERVII